MSTLAGYVDAFGFLSFGNFFVSFMSGNTTRLGIGLAGGDFRYAFLALGVIGLFVAGVIVGTLVGNRATHRRPSILVLVALLLAAAATCHQLGLQRICIGLMLLAMGAENTVFQSDGEISIGLTYMTGTLVKLGQRLAAMIGGRRPEPWAPYLLLWVGLAAGATGGALTRSVIGSSGLWFGAAAALALAYYARGLKNTSR